MCKLQYLKPVYAGEPICLLGTECSLEPGGQHRWKFEVTSLDAIDLDDCTTLKKRILLAEICMI